MSRRFKSRHGKVKADPKAEPARPVELGHENSYANPLQPDCRLPIPRGRVFVRAESAQQLESAREVSDTLE